MHCHCYMLLHHAIPYKEEVQQAINLIPGQKVLISPKGLQPSLKEWSHFDLKKLSHWRN